MNNQYALRIAGALAALSCVSAAMHVNAQEKAPVPPAGTTPQVAQQVTGYRADYIPPNRHPTDDQRRLSPGDSYQIGHAPLLVAQPEHSVRIYIRYPRSYGYRDLDSAMQPAPNACTVFDVGVRDDSGQRQDQPFPARPIGGPSMIGDDVLCAFQVDGVPFDSPMLAWAGLSDVRNDATGPWQGGAQAQPPAGLRRAIADAQRHLTLTASEPAARIDLRMSYQ